MRPARIVIAIFAVLTLVIGAGAAAPIVVPPINEQLVEGHSVFSVVEQYACVGCPTIENETRYAASVAVLVREVSEKNYRNTFRFPGVLWFNDQYLVNPQSRTINTIEAPTDRYPCTGAVLAVPAGNPDPRVGAPNFTMAEYVETYHITDPLDHVWDIDKWNFSGNFVWTVPIMNKVAGYSTPDNGAACNSNRYMDATCGDVFEVNGYQCGTLGSFLGITGTGEYVRNPGDNSSGTTPYPCRTCGALRYNAVLFFWLSDLSASGVTKNHTYGSTDYKNDIAGCQSQTTRSNAKWPCPQGNDDFEGNSHPYNPMDVYPVKESARAPFHGRSANCDADPEGDDDCHATYRIDLYYDVAALPSPRNTTFTDNVGSTAPYHCHEQSIGLANQPAWCNERDSPWSEL